MANHSGGYLTPPVKVSPARQGAGKVHPPHSRIVNQSTPAKKFVPSLKLIGTPPPLRKPPRPQHQPEVVPSHDSHSQQNADMTSNATSNGGFASHDFLTPAVGVVNANRSSEEERGVVTRTAQQGLPDQDMAALGVNGDTREEEVGRALWDGKAREEGERGVVPAKGAGDGVVKAGTKRGAGGKKSKAKRSRRDRNRQQSRVEEKDTHPSYETPPLNNSQVDATTPEQPSMEVSYAADKFNKVTPPMEPLPPHVSQLSRMEPLPPPQLGRMEPIPPPHTSQLNRMEPLPPQTRTAPPTHPPLVPIQHAGRGPHQQGGVAVPSSSSPDVRPRVTGRHPHFPASQPPPNLVSISSTPIPDLPTGLSSESVMQQATPTHSTAPPTSAGDLTGIGFGTVRVKTEPGLEHSETNETPHAPKVRVWCALFRICPVHHYARY